MPVNAIHDDVAARCYSEMSILLYFKVSPLPAHKETGIGDYATREAGWSSTQDLVLEEDPFSDFTDLEY